ncbi:MAG: polysaccharide biosynthesis/export family protein [Sodaliphilus sp.]|nr:polysaccharide biosynthesis/export family protein [Sodaliphilus sp.]
MKNRILFAIISLVVLASCSSTKDNKLVYFKNLTGNDGVLANVDDKYIIRVQPDDELIITITSSVPEATAMYNLPLGNPSTRGNVTASSQPRLQTYIVDPKGDIELPLIGKLHVQGLTTNEISELIKGKVAQNVKDPFVRVEMIQFGVNVMGEVQSPHRVEINKQRFTLLDALSAAGDLTVYAKRDNILIMRTENGQLTYHRVSLNDPELFKSPYFYMQQNDVVYVEPNKIRTNNSKYDQNNAYKLSVISTVVSAVSVIASLVIALTR